MSVRRLMIVGAMMEAAYVSFYFVTESAAAILLFIAGHTFVFLLLAFVWWRSRTVNPGPHTVGLVVGFAVLFRLTLVFHAPVGSDDIYRYVWDGKVAAHGINPYALAPSDSSLVHLHTDELPSKINHPTMRTIYPPLAQALFAASNLLFGDSVAGLKFLFVLADVATILILVKLFNCPLDKLLLYAWSPLPVLYFALDGHVDALGIPLLLLALYLLQRNKPLKGSLLLGLAALTKLYPLLIAPFLFHCTKGWKRMAVPAIPVVVLLLGCWLYWEPTGGLFESFIIYNTTFEFNGSVFQLLRALIGSNETARLLSAVGFVIWWGTAFALDRPLLEKMFLTFVGFIVCAPTVHPWYLTWVAVLLPLRWSLPVFVLLALSALSNLVVYEYRLLGVWQEKTWLLLAEYVPFFLLLLREAMRGTFLPRRASAGAGG